MKRNVPLLGFVIGLILPLIAIVVLNIAWQLGPLTALPRIFFSNHDLGAKILSLAIIVNALPFIYYTSKRLDLTARGIFVSTLLFALLIVLLRFVWT